MSNRKSGRILWPEKDLTRLEDGTDFDHGTDIRVLVNRSESFRFAADVLVQHCFSEPLATPNVGKDLASIGLGCCKWPDMSFAIGNLYWHHIELLMKVIILLGRRLCGQQSDFPRGHGLNKIWPEARNHIKVHPSLAQMADLDEAENRIKKLADIEKDTREFRYPLSGDDWDKALPGKDELKNLFAPLGKYLSHCVSVMWNARKEQRLGS